MKENEVRVGNLAIDATGEERPIDLSDFAYESDTTFDFEKWLFIPLTAEWLLKFGFEIEYGTYRLDGLGFSFTIDLSTGLANISPGGRFDETYGIDIPCRYVHQLQNLYFTLTGKELELKELK